MYYFAAEIIGALLASLFVKYFIGNEAHLGANTFNHSYPISVVFGISPSFGFIDGCNSDSSIYQRLERT
jgi:hypothetical protein